MGSAHKLTPVETLPRTPASEVKKLGWRSVVQSVNREGKVVVTNHRQFDAVILSVEEYTSIQQALAKAADQERSALDTLRERFDARMASLRTPDAGDRLRDLMRGPARLDGQVKAGTGH